jgi:hypothetical protein
MSLNSMLLRGTAASKPGTSTFVGQLYLESDGSKIMWQGDSSLAWVEVARGVNVQTIAKSGSTALTGAVTLSEGSNVTLTQSGNDISLASTAGTVTFISIAKWGGLDG